MKIKTISLFVLLSALIVGDVYAGELVLAVGRGDRDLARIGSTLAGILTDDTTTVRAVGSGGDTESIASLLSGSADLAVVDSLSAYEASLGIGRFTPTKKKGPFAAAVVGLSIEHFLLAAPAEDPQDISALSGKILYLGPSNDTKTYAARIIISSLGIGSFFEVGMNWDYETAAELMVDGTFDGAVFSGVVPLDPVSHLTSVMGRHVVLLEISNEKIVKIRSQWPIWFPYVVREKTYPAVDKPYGTIARPILLLAAQGLDKTTIKDLLVRLFERAGDPTSTGLPYPVTESMTLTYCPIKFHPGAADYFKEHGY